MAIRRWERFVIKTKTLRWIARVLLIAWDCSMEQLRERTAGTLRPSYQATGAPKIAHATNRLAPIRTMNPTPAPVRQATSNQASLRFAVKSVHLCYIAWDRYKIGMRLQPKHVVEPWWRAEW